MLVSFTSLQNIVILLIIVIVRATVKRTNVVSPHNGTYDLCVFVIFSKTGFVDIALKNGRAACADGITAELLKGAEKPIS